ncbi:MAG: GGDEF domain-containing protein [Lachnospiraceae bacterium]|nr:GGDEF domain-containing protein [Lachnospiraceae bacterium]MEE1100297.1 diguanylate cyclase [Agathobacter sp.]
MKRKQYNEDIKQLINNIEQYCSTNAELSLNNCCKLVEYGRENDDVYLLGFGYYHMAMINYYLNDGKLFLETIPTAIRYLEESGQWDLLARSYNILGITAFNRGNEPIALDYYFNGLSYCRKYDIPEVRVILNVNCGALYLRSGCYSDARKYLNMAKDYMESNTQHEQYHTYMMCIYVNLARCETKESNFAQAQEYFDIIENKHISESGYLDQLGLLCAKADFYHCKKDFAQRDKCITQIDNALCDDITLMDIFDELYMHAKLLFDCGKDEEFWNLIDTIEPMVKSVNITYMLLKELALKIKYYRTHKISADYLKSAGLYFELSERHEEESKNMVMNILNLRSSLEDANEARRKAEKENKILSVKSETDQLTSLFNRFKLNDYLDEAFAYCIKNNCTMAIEMLDIDYFKEFNDNYGHHAGDKCLKAVADSLSYMAQKHNGFAARYGGDEFVIIYLDIDLQTAEAYSKELKEIIKSKSIIHEYSEVDSLVTISQGICCDIPLRKNKVFDYLYAADDFLYKTKEAGKNGYTVGKYNINRNC